MSLSAGGRRAWPMRRWPAPIVGTVEYMAPEQAQGQPVDQRADIYALGLILYDMLRRTAAREQADSALDELQARMEQPPPPVRSVDAEVPEALDRLVSRCLEPDPAKRYQTTRGAGRRARSPRRRGEPIPSIASSDAAHDGGDRRRW